ncbi:hypothetical protein PAESOLCIP111_04170 [Paenibacillus solanacearum]|uniref:Extracellular solute-binding protein n=1 Tax=Paenibacillus solanacearum TaxID=2048548 RepID=A0A916K3W2_9BACL|nr:extracellular solute-binding protein [Paenibacillus solanacearum]CAG7640771.1 hypothetical protein PAESOLCIP111_04170 [Paenibacillus solanacearum]
MWSKSLQTVITLSIVLFAAGCGSGEPVSTGASKAPDSGGADAKTAVKENTDPVELTLFMNNLISDADLQRVLFEPLKKKYPYITVKPTFKGGKETIDNWVVSGNPPDLFNYYAGDMGVLVQLGLVEDITPLAKKHNIDLSRFQPAMLDSVRAVSGKGELYALPRYSNTVALYYNKDIFDKFGVSYPKDGMTWDQTIELAKKLTRADGGKNYYGLSFDNLLRPGYSFSLDALDPKTNKAAVNSNDWRRVMQLNRDIFSIPGNLPNPVKLVNSGHTVFTANMDLAMLASVNNFRWIEPAAEKGLNWDMVQYPYFPDKPNIGGMVDVHAIGVAKTSKHKDAAMKVLELMTSDEVQLIAARSGAASPLSNPEMQKQFGADVAFLKGKNVQAFFKSKPAPTPQFSNYRTEAYSVFNPLYLDYVSGKMDLNTFIRTAEEAINKKIEEVAKK